jgi:oligopeptide/dipeptide ABC transporter ATP-binding protein
MTATKLLAVENLSVTLRPAGEATPVLRGIDFALDAGEALALVGESGCGKTVTALALLGLLPVTATVGGHIMWRGHDLNRLTPSARSAYRGRQLAMVFQEPNTSLNPVFTAGEQIAEALRYHHRLTRREAAQRAVELLHEVQVPDPAYKAGCYPHQLSGGMKQRVGLAMALACEPSLLVADEPTTALDVTVQSQILYLLRDLCQRHNMALIFITHDLALVPLIARRIAVMYGGLLVETGPVTRVLKAPAHPYTRALIQTLPEHWPDQGPIPQLPGLPPDPSHPAEGCPFAPRCAWVRAQCREQIPAPVAVAATHRVACLSQVAGPLAEQEVIG